MDAVTGVVKTKLFGIAIFAKYVETKNAKIALTDIHAKNVVWNFVKIVAQNIKTCTKNNNSILKKLTLS
jgi:hypothetical protein